MGTTSTIAATAGLALCTACFAPFPNDRHDLVDFRIVGVQVSDAAPGPGEVLTAKALVYGGGGFYHDQLPTLVWRLGELELEGPVVQIVTPAESGVWDLELVATHADGVLQEQAVLPISVGEGQQPVTPPILPGIQRGVVEFPLDAAAEAYGLATRVELDTASGRGGVMPGQAARLRLPLEDPDGRYQARWMSAGGLGSFLELDALTVDWLPATLFLDEEDGEIEVGEVLEPGLYAVAALVIDGMGSASWAFLDVAYDTEPFSGFDGANFWVEHDGRLLEMASPPLESGMVEVKLVQDDESPWGVGLRGAQPVAPWSTETTSDNLSIPCEHPIPARGPFRLDWIAEGLCSRQAVLGQRVRLQVDYPIRSWNSQ